MAQRQAQRELDWYQRWYQKTTHEPLTQRRQRPKWTHLNWREARGTIPPRTPEAPPIDFEDRGAHLDPCTPWTMLQAIRVPT